LKALRKNWLPDSFYRRPETTWMTMTAKELRETLLATDGQILANGQLWSIKSKSLGVGVYRVSLVCIAYLS
jgi:hypothetical protein